MKKFLLLLVLLVSNKIDSIAQCNLDTITGLIAKWDFNGNANDLSGNSHNGTVVGAIPTTSRCNVINNAYYSDGVGGNQYINVANSTALNLNNTDFTISAWIKSDYVISTNGVILAKRNGSFLNDGYIFGIYGTDQHLFFGISGGGTGSVGMDSRSVIDTNSWKHVVVTYNNVNDTMKMYINGLLDTAVGNLPSPAPTNSIFRIGNDSYVGSYEFHGKIDDIRMYNRALDSCAINALYNQSCYTITYRFIGNGNWSNNTNWLNNQMPPATIFAGTQVIIAPQSDGECNVDIPVTISSGTSFKIIPGSKLRASANLFFQR